MEERRVLFKQCSSGRHRHRPCALGLPWAPVTPYTEGFAPAGDVCAG